MKRQFRRPLIALLILPLLFAAGLGNAMAGSTQTATLRGKVTDEKGEPLVGVTLSLKSDALIRERALISGADGTFFLPGLPSGDYTVTARLDGYITTAVDTQLVVDQTTRLAIVLKAGAMTETVTVTAEKPVVDKTSTVGETVVDKTFTESLPLGRGYQSLVAFAPGVINPGGGNPNILGGTSSSNNYLVEGVSARDPVTGTFGLNYTYDSIEAVDTKLFGVSAEYGQFQGGVTNIITRSGGNDFTGSVRSVLSSPSWTDDYGHNRNAFSPSLPPPDRPAPFDAKRTNNIETTIGGPIVRDHAWFLISYNKIQRAQSFLLGNPTGGPAGKGFFPATRQFDISLIKGTWQISNNHKVTYQWSEDPGNVPVCYAAAFFGGSCYEQYNVEKQQQGGFDWVAKWNAVWGPRVFTDVKVTRFRDGFPGNVPYAPVPNYPDLPHGRTGMMALGIDLGSGTGFDNTVFSPVPDQRPREQYEASTTMFFDTKNMGSHTLKVGLDYNKTEHLGTNTLAGDAIFYFAFVNPPPGLGGTGNAYDINNREYFYWIDFAPPGSNKTSNKQTDIYVQDDWQLSRHWTLNLGIRGERSVNENDVGEKIIDSTGIAPRLGASYDITGEGKHILKATAGRYLAGINLTTLSPFVRQGGGQSEYNVWYNANAPEPGTPDWVLLGSASPCPTCTTYDPNIKPQHIDEYSLSYEWGIAPTMGLKFHLVDRKWGNITTVRYAWDYTDGPLKITNIYNNPNAKREYKAAMLEFEKRLAHNWQLLANYTYSKSEGNVSSDNGFDSYESYMGVPQTTQNRYGRESWDRPNVLNAYGVYNVPLHSSRHALSVGGGVTFTSGYAFSRVTSGSGQNVVVGPGPNGIQDVALGSPASVASGTDDQTDTVTTFYEPRGSYRSPNNWTLNLSANYRFHLTKKVTWQTMLEIYNATNNQNAVTVTAAVPASNPNDPHFGYPSGYTQLQQPRRYDFVIALIW